MLLRDNHQHRRIILDKYYVILILSMNVTASLRKFVQSMRSTKKLGRKPGRSFLIVTSRRLWPCQKWEVASRPSFLCSWRFMLSPRWRTNDRSNIDFCFEELENNLHPAIQKRLFRFLRDVVRNEHCVMLITTHSHVVIDLFSNDEDAQLIHVSHDEKDIRLSKVEAVTARVINESVRRPWCASERSLAIKLRHLGRGSFRSRAL